MRSSPLARSFALISAFAISLIAMVFLFSQPVMAQATTGNLKGTVLDPSAAAVAGATITVKNEGTGVELTSTGSGDGTFFAANLPPGKYTVTVAATNFKTAAVTGVDVRLGETADIKVELAVGSPTETVTVTANTEEVVQTTSQQSSSFEARKVEELPSNSAGGGIDTLALLAPGVVPGFGNVNSNGTTLSVNGNRARANNFTLDGTDNNDLSIGGPNFFISNSDSVQEFQIITNNFSAQYGRNQGAVVNIVTKSGTNEFHGTAFEYHRNASSFDAKTNAERADPNRGPTRDKFISNVFGGTFGGPIKKNKAFFFVDGQLIRQRQNFTFTTTAPVITRDGLATLSAQYPGNPVIAAMANQSLAALQNVRIATPAGNVCFPRNGALPFSCDPASPDFANGLAVPAAFVRWDIPLPFNQKEFGLRGDVNPTDKDSFNVKYRYQQSPESNFNTGSNGFFGDIPFKSRNFNGAWTRQIGNHITNEFKGAWQKLSVIFGGCSLGSSDPLKGCITSTDKLDDNFTNITFNGITAGGVSLQSIGPATNLPQGREVAVLQFSDALSWTHGHHTMMLGADFRHLTNKVPFLPNINGAFRFSTTTRIVNNQPSFVTLVGGNPVISYKENDKFFFFQDNFKVRDNVTLELGVRYEYTGQPINTLHDLSVATESNPATALWLQTIPLANRTVPKLPIDKNNWAPRIGIAWSPHFGEGGLGKMLFGENDATVVRAGYSIAYDPAFYNILLNVSTSAPLVFNNQLLQPPLAFSMPANPTGSVVRSALAAGLQRNTFDPRFFTQTGVGQDFHSPYSQQWSLGVQRQLNRNNVAEIRYVGNHAVGLFQSINRNPFIGSALTNTNPLSPCFGQFTNGGIAHGFCSAGFGTTSFTFPGFPNQIPAGVTPQVCVDNPATPAVNEAVCDGRILPQGLLRTRENTASSSYNGLQARYNGRFANQLTFGASYAFSKTLDNASEIFSFGEGAFGQNPFNLGKGEWSISGNDRPHAGALNFIWDMPWFKNQHGFEGHILGGWQINGTYNLASGRPFNVSEIYNIFGARTHEDAAFQNNFVGYDQLRPFWGNPNAPRNLVAITDVDAAYFSGLIVGASPFVASPTGFFSFNEYNRSGTLVPVTLNDVRYVFNGPGAAQRFGTPYGNVPRNTERGPALDQLNIGIFKNTKVRENLRVQFRAELFNALNRPNPGIGVANQDEFPDNFMEDAGLFGGAGSLTGFNDKGAMTLSSRRVQFGIRIIF